MIITFLIILFVQGLNCLLEIGFLANNLKENNLRRFYIIGNEIRRKLNTSLIFGKPVSQLNYQKLLSNILPQDIGNLHVTDKTGKVVYSLRKGENQQTFQVNLQVKQVVIRDSYNIFLPLENRSGVQGNIIMVVSLRDTRESMYVMLRQSLIHFLTILGISLPLLYALLTIFVNRPYNRFVSDLSVWFTQGRFDRLSENGMDLFSLDMVEGEIKAMRGSPLLSDEGICGQLDLMVPETDEQTARDRLDRELTRIMGTG